MGARPCVATMKESKSNTRGKWWSYWRGQSVT